MSESSKWIPVSERLPEDQFTKLVSDGRFQRVAYFSLRAWRDPNALEILTSVTHWMDLPAPPQPPELEDPFEAWWNALEPCTGTNLRRFKDVILRREIAEDIWNAAQGK